MNNVIHKLKQMYYLIMGLFGLSFVIITHEFGHFLTAKLFQVATPIFSIGFGPALLATKIGQTTFQIAAIPFGGYVAMSPEDLAAQPYPNKMIIILAGIFFNVVFAYLVMVYLAMHGKYKMLPIITNIIPHSPAQKSGLAVNDQVMAFNNAPTGEDIEEFLHYVGTSPGKTITVTVKRNQTTHDIPITLGTSHPILGPNVGWLGTKWQTVKIHQPTLWQALVEGKNTILAMLQNIGGFTATTFKKAGRAGIIGPIGIIVMTGRSLALSPQYFALILAVVSMNVALFNLLPIPFLDGGKAVQYTIEAFVGPLPTGILNYITIIFLILFLLLIFSVTVGDIKRLWKRK